MNITQTAIKRGVTFLMIYLIAIGFGLFSFVRLNVDLYPEMEFPVIAILSQYTGVGPFDIETVLTRPIEETVASVQNVKKVSSTSAQGFSLVMLEFDWGTDMDQAEIDVRNTLEFVRDYLPDDATEPLIMAFDPSTQPILFLAIDSEIHGQAELRRISEHDIEPRIERIPGVASVFTSGGMRREIKILVDPVRLRAHNLSIQQVSAALQMSNQQLPSGWIDNDNQEFTIQTAGEFTSVEQIENTNIMSRGRSVIRIKDVATVVDGFAEQRQKVWNNNKPAVIAIIQKQSDANTVQVCEAVTSQFRKIESEIPKGIRINTIWDQSTFINRSMANLGRTALQAIGLAFLVILFFLRNIRSSLIVAVSIPISLIVTFAVMDQAGLTLNMISMAGLALSVGLLVDNSIVVLESIFRIREEGEKPRDAAYKGAKEVAMAITASTLTTLSVFLPILFVPGLAGELFNDMVVIICFSLAISLLVALTLIPLLASRLLQRQEQYGIKKRFSRIGNTVGGWITGFQKSYLRILDWALVHRKTIILSAIALFILSVITIANLGGEFLPKSDMGYMSLAIDRAPGTSLEAMEKSMTKINQIISKNVPEAENVYANFGQGEGLMALFSSRSSAEGDITIGLVKRSERNRDMFAIEDVLRDKFRTLPGVDIEFEDRGAALFNAAGDISIEIIGHDLTVAEALANDIEKKVKDIDGIVHIENTIRESAPELKINLDRQRIADLGLSTAQVGQVVSTSILGSVVTQYREKGDEYDVRVQLSNEARTNKQDVENILIMTPVGRSVPLRAIANIEYTKAPREISREDQERMVAVNIDVSGRDLRSVTNDVKSAIRDVTIPTDFRIAIGGVAEDQQESFMYLGLAMLVAVLLTYMVMASQFESFVDPFIILFTIPLSFIGVALALVVTGTTLSVMALVGIIMLVGIVVNNGIVLVDYINQMRERGLELFPAIMEAGRVRMRPVLMTALTTILAMLPLALGVGESGENWAPMARSVMGGMLVSSLLTLIVVPVIYAVLELIAEKSKAKRRARLEAKYGEKLVTEQA